MTASAAPAEGPGGWAELVTPARLPTLALILFSVWLGAADTLVSVTLMPKVVGDLGGYRYFSWAVTAFVLGSIVAGATAGRAAERLGVGRGLAVAAGVYAAGCALSATAPGMFAFLGGRLVQGLAAGWLGGMNMVAIGAVFPERIRPKVFSAVAGVWAAATLLGPLLGGVFADAGVWRGAFWAFAVQALVFAPIALVRFGGERGQPGPEGSPLRQLLVLIAAVLAMALASVARGPGLGSATALVALGFFAGFLALDRRARFRLLPRSAADPRTVAGAAYAATFFQFAAVIVWSVYGAAYLQALHGVSALTSGYVVGCEALGWTLASWVVSHLTGAARRRSIRLGAVAVALGAFGLAAVLAPAPVVVSAAMAGLMGAGFGLSYALVIELILADLPSDEQGLGAAAVSNVQQMGNALAAAFAGLIANALGVGEGLTPELARRTAFPLFFALAPLALIGLAAAWRATRETPASAPVNP